MTIFGVKTSTNADKYMEESNERISGPSTYFLFHDSFIKKIGENKYVICLQPNFPNFYLVGFVPLAFGLLFNILWLVYLGFIFSGVTYFFFTRYFFYLGMLLAVKKKKLGFRPKLMSDDELKRCLVLGAD